MTRKRYPDSIKLNFPSEPEDQTILQLWLRENPGRTQEDFDKIIADIGTGRSKLRGIFKRKLPLPGVRNGMFYSEYLVYSLSLRK